MKPTATLTLTLLAFPLLTVLTSAPSTFAQAKTLRAKTHAKSAGTGSVQKAVIQQANARLLQAWKQLRVDPQKSDEENTAKNHAVWRVAARAIAQGATDVNLGRLTQAKTPLYWATVFHDFPSLRLLVRRGAEVTPTGGDYGDTPLHAAAATNAPYIATFLLEHGADVDQSDMMQYTPLCLAISSKSDQVVPVLLSHKANVNAIIRWGGTPLTIAIERGSGKDTVKMVALLLAHGADANSSAGGGVTALQMASRGNNAEIVSLLLAHGAKVNVAYNELGRTALHDAAKADAERVVPILLAHGAAVNALDRKGLTPLSLAKQYKATKVIAQLTAAGAHE